MTEQERAVVEAAKAWAKNPGDATSLMAAVRKLEENTCMSQGILGDAGWPISVSCERPADHPEEYHKDPVRGLEWRSPRR